MISQESVVEGLIADRSKLLAYIWSLLRDHHDTEDLFEEIVVLAMKNAGKIQDREHLLAWARRAARHRAINHLRHKGRHPVLLREDVLNQLEAQWHNLDAQPAQSRAEALRLCLDQMTPRSQRIVALRYGKGMSGQEVAAVTGQQVHSVYVALTRIYRALEDCVRRRLEEELRS
jgi:RNA polymerase sigma-70 factor, ECF subfamily